jgi:hypothetical protein
MIKVGDRFETRNYGFCTVIEYIDSYNVRIRFEDGIEITCTAGALRTGQVKNPNHPSICGIGFIGIGIYSRKTHLRIYDIWKCMLGRCYDEGYKNLHPTYKSCTVCERWLNFQNFAHDYLQMVGSDLNWQLDKDILFKRNKIYSPETCCLVPPQINTLLIKHVARRGEFRIGVSYDEHYINPYIAKCHIKGKIKYLGSYKTEQEAHLRYKAAKEQEIRRLANLFKDQLDPRVYIALMNYEVEMDD